MNSSSSSTGAPQRATAEQRALAFLDLEDMVHDLKNMAATVALIAETTLGDRREAAVKISPRLADLFAFSIYDVESRARVLCERFEAANTGERTK